MSALLFGQVGPTIYQRDMPNMISAPSYSYEEGLRYNDESFLSHPDFGKMTFGAPYGKNVVEVIGKRQIDQRYYIDIDDPLFFYIEKSNKPINIEIDGVMRAIDFSLHELSKGEFSSGFQRNITSISTLDKCSGMEIENELMRFNNYHLKKVNFDGSIEILESNWSNVTVTNFSCHVLDIFPSIDMKIEFHEGKVKSNLIIKQNLNVKELVFIDNLDLPVGYGAVSSNNNPFNINFIEIYNQATSVTEVVVDPARTFDTSQNGESWISTFEIQGGNLLITCDSAHLNSASIVYPITVDPTFTAVGPVTNGGGVMGSLPSPASCTNNLVVNFPGGSTPWDTQISWTVVSDFCAWILVDFGFFFDCYMSEAQVRVTSSCGGASPSAAGVWTCPGCNTIGTWTPTLGFNQAGTQSLVQCYAPSCANQNLTFTISLNRLTCASNYGYDNCVWLNSYCQSLDAWSVTVQGRSVETLGNTATGNGTQNIFDADCAGSQTLNPTPQYGVGGYTYAWSHGPTTPTVSVPGTVSTYTVDVTDACGNTVTATFDIGCPLSAEITDFSGIKNRNDIELHLKLLAEENLESITFMKSGDGENWTALKSLQTNGELDYAAIDESPMNGLNYYRVFFTDIDGVQSKSEIIEIEFNYEYSVYPNPAQNEIYFSSLNSAKKPSKIVLVDLTGRVLLTRELFNSNTTIDISTLENGNYSALIYSMGELVDSKRISVLR